VASFLTSLLSSLSSNFKQKDLIRRLGNVVQVLRYDETVEADCAEWPGLGGVAQYIVEHFVRHQDKDVRLYAILACMEIFTIVRKMKNRRLRSHHIDVANIRRLHD
jgi:hypothetical protein